MSFTQTAQTNQIRQNRFRMRNSLKVNIIGHDKKKNEQNPSQATNNQELKTQTNFEILYPVQKESIQDHFQDSYDLKQKIGQGAHGIVYRCVNKFTGKDSAVKITKQGHQQLIEESKIKSQILQNLNHQNVMNGQKFYIDHIKLTTYLVCELCNYPQLAVYMRNKKNKSLSEDQATFIIMSIIQTLQYLHQSGVCHRDIKPENILYDPQNKQIKIIDFDSAIKKKQLDSKFQMWTKTGSLHYQAPEYFNGPTYDEKVDLWAAGVIAFEMVNGSVPFDSLYSNRMIKMIIEDEASIQALNVSKQFKFMVKKLLEKNPAKRYTASQCLRLPVFLKCQQIPKKKIFDGFDSKPKVQVRKRPVSQTQKSIKNRDKKTQDQNSPIPVLKFYCFVPKI